MTGVYRIPALHATYRVAFTNATPVSSYRGAGRPDIAYVVERLVNQAAAELKIDAAELRRRNFIPPEAFPYKTPTGSVYENADLPGLLDKALKLADWKGYPKRRAQSEKKGRLRGIGIATVIENTGAGAALKDDVEIVLEKDGNVTVHTQSKSQGHGHETTFAMIVSDALGIGWRNTGLQTGSVSPVSRPGSGGTNTRKSHAEIAETAEKDRRIQIML